MKMRSFFFLSAIALLFSGGLYGQSYTETALLFSQTRPGGSARIQALGGTQISLGGDFSSAYSNPAGLGMYNRSEFALSIGQRGITNDTRYFGTKVSEDDSKLNIPGFAAVFNVPSGRDGGSFIGGSFAISFNRINDFNNTIRYRGDNNANSIIPSFMEAAWGATTDQFMEGGYNYNSPVGLAYYNYLFGPTDALDPSFPRDQYFTDVQSNFQEYLSDARQAEQIVTSGASNQWSISYGANFDDRIFVGGGIGITSIRYKSNKLFAESYDVDPFFTGLELDETLRITGSGINATLGAIFRPVDFIQVGVAYTTPTYYELVERYEAWMDTEWKQFDYYGDGKTILNNESAGTDVVTSEYNFRAPSRLSAGATFLSKYGFVSADVEYMNPSKAKYSSEIDGISYAPENDDIRRDLESTLNFRLGAEFRYNILRVRGGFSSQASGWANEALGKRINAISGGLGVRFKRAYVDFALIQTKRDSQYIPYHLSENGPLFEEVDSGNMDIQLFSPVVDIKQKILTGMITIGITY